MLCDMYGHYSHHCPKLPKSQDALSIPFKLDNAIE